ncbi:MAG TPA: 50S ribosomal protein L1 [Thermoplasmatales archaeon]|nr:50S ribosomal protein L1 [Thermoplasmatales archaeon]
MASKEILEAVEKALSEENNKKRKFVQSVDLVINLKDVDLKKPENRIDEEIELPKGRGKEAKVAVFASGELAFKAKNVADAVITPEQIKELAEDKKKAKKLAEEYDFFIAEAPLMPTIGRALGRVFAPRGKMPKPIPPDADIEAIVNKLRKSIRIRSKDKPTFHCLVGREDMSPEDIAENVEAILERIESKLERGRMNIRSAYIKTTMGSAVRVI